MKGYISIVFVEWAQIIPGVSSFILYITAQDIPGYIYIYMKSTMEVHLHFKQNYAMSYHYCL